MKVQELLKLLSQYPPENEVMVMDNGSALRVASYRENEEYNLDPEGDGVFYLVTEEWQ